MCSIFREKNGSNVGREHKVTNVEKIQKSTDTLKVTPEKKTVTEKCKNLLKKTAKNDKKWKSDSCDFLVTKKMKKHHFCYWANNRHPPKCRKCYRFFTQKKGKKGNQIKNQLKKNRINCNNMEEE